MQDCISPLYIVVAEISKDEGLHDFGQQDKGRPDAITERVPNETVAINDLPDVNDKIHTKKKSFDNFEDVRLMYKEDMKSDIIHKNMKAVQIESIEYSAQ